MFGSHPSKRCPFCNRPLPFGMYIFCCNECQRCWHRQNSSHPKDMSKVGRVHNRNRYRKHRKGAGIALGG